MKQIKFALQFTEGEVTQDIKDMHFPSSGYFDQWIHEPWVCEPAETKWQDYGLFGVFKKKK